MERVTVQFNGEQVTLDVPDGMPDDQIIAYLQQQTQQQTSQQMTQAPVNPADYATPTAVGTAAGAARPLMGGVATANARDVVNVAKNAASWTPNALMEVVSHPISSAKAYVGGHPLANTPIKQIAGGIGKNVAGAVAQGLLGPETMFAAPYQMAAYEMDRIRQDPTRPLTNTNPFTGNQVVQDTLEFNPFAQMTRGQAATQGQAGAQNRRGAIAGQQYGGLTANEQRMLEQDRIDQAIRRKAAEKVLGPVIPPGY
jgi:hypothetical protein